MIHYKITAKGKKVISALKGLKKPISPEAVAVLDIAKDGIIEKSELVENIGLNKHVAADTLSLLEQLGLVEEIK